MTYRELIENPADGIYRTFDNKRILIDKGRVIHVPSGATFSDDQEFKEEK